MARGSGSGSGGGDGGGESGAVGMLGESGQIQNSGKYVVRKKFLVTNAADLTRAPAGPQGFRPVALSYQEIGGGAYEQTVDYEYFLGTAGDGSVVETQGGIKGRFELDVEDELRPIGSHPNILKLIERYNGQVDGNKVTFPPRYTPVAGAGLQSGGGEQTNPMAGKLFWNKPAAVFRHTQQMDAVPSDVWNNVGKKIERLPAGFPNFPPGVNDNGEQIKYYWIVLSPQIYRRGNAYEIVRSYKLSDGNIPEELHRSGEASTTDTGGGS